MNSGFGPNLEGFLIKGNLSVITAELPEYQGNGSIEGAGTLYFDRIQEYTNSTGVTIQGVIIQNNQVIIPYTQPSINLSSASFLIDGGISIRTSQNATSPTSGGALTIKGGVGIAEELHVGNLVTFYDTLDMKYTPIIHVAEPINPSDAATKYYVDSKTYGNIAGTFNPTEIIIGDTNQQVTSSSQLTFDGDLFFLGADLSVTGNASFGSTIILNYDTIQNVGEPINPSDVATKFYVDSKTYGTLTGSFGSYELVVAASNGTTVLSYPQFKFDGTQLYLGTTENAIGLGSGGSLTVLGGASFSKDVFIGGTLDMTYGKIENVLTPTLPFDAVNKAYVDALFQSCCEGSTGGELTITLNNSQFEFIDIPELTFEPYVYAFISYIYVNYTGVNGTLCAIYTIRGINKEAGGWYINSSYIGDRTGVLFNIRQQIPDGEGIIQYTNENVEGVTYIIVKTEQGPRTTEINDTMSIVTLLANTSIPLPVSEEDLTYSFDQESFYVSIYVVVEELGLYTLFDLEGVNCGTTWRLNSKWIGDRTEIIFSITDNGVIEYTNLHSYDANIRFRKDTFRAPLLVPDGGTGNISLLQDAILRGNGIQPIKASADFLYKNYQLQLGNVSSLLIKNSSSGSLETYGGARIGTSLFVGNVDITPSVGDITKEKSFSASNDINIPTNITGFDLSNVNIKSFSGIICVILVQTTGESSILYDIRALRQTSGWIFKSTLELGDDLGIDFSINTSGQVRYTSPNFNNFTSLTFRYRGTTTTI